MATMYCALCDRPVEARRHIGAGTIILAVVTAGVSLVAIPFYQKRCSICKSTAVSQIAPARSGAAGPPALARVKALEERLSNTESELERANTEIDHLRTERDFYRQLLGDKPRERLPGNPAE